MDAESASACLGTDTLLDFIEGRANVQQHAAIEQHASRCDECRRVLSSLARDRATAALSPGDAPTALAPTEHTTTANAELDDELAPGDSVARYVIRKRLGAGGMGVVYAALDPELGREVAIKLLAPGLDSSRTILEERLRREARALAQLAHPNVVAIHDVGRVGDRLFLAMELLDGETIARWCRSERRPPRAILEHFVAAGRGLAAAHAAGIIHRDVKPENMMLGKDGRVRVVDFGLARTTGMAELAPSDGTASSDSALTRAGAVMGTPHYMAPEQYRGEEADARSDQFAFAVALYYALYDQRPFAGEDLETLKRNVEAGAVREPPRRRGVPRRIWRALRRGMSPSPAARFGALDELLVAIAPASRARWVPIAAAGALTMAAGALWISTRHGDKPAPCEDMAVHLAGVWDPARRDSMTGALHASGAPSSDATVQTVVARLDDYTARWVAMRGDACTATRVRGDQTEDVMGLRMACLDDRLREVGVLVDRLRVADRATAAHAVAATYQLTDLAACADVAALRRPGKPPQDPALVAAVRGKLASARVLHATGRFRDGLVVVTATANDVAAAVYRPLEAEAALVEGTLQNDLDASAAAIAALEHAVFAAEACGYDEIAAKALIQLVHLHGQHGRFVEADAAHQRATAALERIGHASALSADLDYAVGNVALVRGDLDGAEVALGRAVHTAEATHNDLRLAASLIDLGQVELRRMNGAAAPYLQRALHIEERLLGPDHPDLAKLHVALGGAAYEHDDYDGAAAEYERGIAILEHAIGRNNAQVANALDNLALARQWQDRVGDALAEIREAVAIDEEVLPAADPDTAAHLITEANILEELRRPAEALPIVDRALAMLHALYGTEHQDIADALETRANINFRAGHFEAALADGRASLAMFDRVNPTYPTMEVRRSLGRIELALHHPADALAYFEGALQHPRPGGDPFDAALLSSLYGRALIETNRDRTKGIALVTAAYTTLVADRRAASEVTDLEGFMRSAHVPIPRPTTAKP